MILLRSFIVFIFCWVVSLNNLSFAGSSTVIEMTIDGTIHKGTVSMIEAGLKKVEETKAQALLIQLDTPGGLLDATRDIVKLFLNTDVPIFVYVTPSGAHAGSAGTFITLAAHIAAMAPGTNIGAAHPVSATGKDPEKEGGKHLAQKIEKDTIAFIENIALQRNRNAEWAKKAVLESDAINEKKAKDLNVIDFVAKDVAELLEKAHGKNIKTHSKKIVLNTKDASIVALEVDFGTKVINWLASPAVMFVLLLIAGMGIYMEMSNPGLIFPAVAAGIAIILILIANSVIPLSAVGVGLILLAFALLISEVYVTSFGILATAGIVAFIVGAYLLFDPKNTDLRIPRALIWGAAAGLGAIAVIIGYGVSRTFGARQTAGAEGMVGETGTVEEKITPDSDGRIFVNGEYWNAASDQTLKPGEKIQVVSIAGLVATVKPVK